MPDGGVQAEVIIASLTGTPLSFAAQNLTGSNVPPLLPNLPLIVDAGIGLPSHAAAAMELGYDAVCPKSGVSSIVAKGGVIKLPACDGWSGTVAYPKNNATPGTTSTLTTYSVAHPPAPSSGQGTPATGTVIAWISSIGTGSSASITFCNFPSCPVKYAHISSTTQLNQTHTYELYVYAFGVQQGSEYVGSPVCAKGTTKACKLTFASPLTGQTLPNGILFWFELDDMG